MLSTRFIRRLYLATLTFAGLMVAAAHNVPIAAAADAGLDDTPLVSDSFEDGDTQPRQWSAGAPLPGVRYLWPRQAADGRRSLSLKKTANRYFPIAEWSRTLPLEGSPSALEVKVQVKAQRATKAIVDAQFIDERGEWLSHEWVAYIGAKNDGDPPATHNWKEYAGTVAIPPGTKQIAIGLQIYGPGQVWFDQLEARLVSSGAAPRAASRQDEMPGDVVDVPISPITVAVAAGAIGEYLLVSPQEGVQPPAEGFGLLVVMPGGDGSADFHPFVRRIHANSLNDSFLVAQPLAVKWTPEQQIVWSTAKNAVTGAKFTTEQLVAAVVNDVAKKQKLNRKRVYLLAWSSGGPAAYATLLQAESPATGGLIAMSVFKPDLLPPLSNAKGRGFYLLQSPDDTVCPFWMAEGASKSLAEAGGRATLVQYAGGHGWQGDVFGNIRRGIEWLDERE